MDNSHIALLSALAGGGLFAGSRLLHNGLDAIEGKIPETHGVGTDKIIIKLPKKEEHRESEHHKVALDEWSFPAAGAGLVAGFYGANTLHDKIKKRNAEKDLAEAHAKYNAMLSKLHNTEKTASTTPFVDALCEKLASEEEEHGLIYNFLKHTTGHGSHIPLVSGLASNAGDMTYNNLIAPGMGLMGTIAAVKFLADRTKRRREEETMAKLKTPTQIVIEQ